MNSISNQKAQLSSFILGIEMTYLSLTYLFRKYRIHVYSIPNTLYQIWVYNNQKKRQNPYCNGTYIFIRKKQTAKCLSDGSKCHKE